jgi:small conductance mechanosensitive channel
MDAPTVNALTERGVELVTEFGPRVLGAIVILIVGWIVAGILAGATRKGLTRAGAYEALVSFGSNLVKWAILAFTVIATLNAFGVQTTSFVAVLGAAGFAVGLALQGSLSNFASGVLILVFRPFNIGDFVTAGGSTGKVTEIGILTTILSTPDNQRIIIPNSAVMGGTIVNVNAHDTRRVDLTAGIGYGDDIGKAQALFESILAEHEKVLKDPAPTVKVVELGDSSVNFIVRPWVKTEDYWTVYFDVTRAIKLGCDEAGISIPFPQRDVHLFRESA